MNYLKSLLEKNDFPKPDIILEKEDDTLETATWNLCGCNQQMLIFNKETQRLSVFCGSEIKTWLDLMTFKAFIMEGLNHKKAMENF